MPRFSREPGKNSFLDRVLVRLTVSAATFRTTKGMVLVLGLALALMDRCPHQEFRTPEGPVTSRTLSNRKAPFLLLRPILRLGQKAQTFILRSVSFFLLLCTDKPRPISVLSVFRELLPPTRTHHALPTPIRSISFSVLLKDTILLSLKCPH